MNGQSSGTRGVRRPRRPHTASHFLAGTDGQQQDQQLPPGVTPLRRTRRTTTSSTPNDAA